MLARLARATGAVAARGGLRRQALLHTTRRASAAAADEAAAEEATQVNLNFSCPHGSIYDNEKVDIAILPGVAGEYGVTAGHTPIISELQAGVVQIYHAQDDPEPEKYFISGGFAFTHKNSTTDVCAVEAFKLDELDADAAKANMDEFQRQMDAAPADSRERAEAQIGHETNKAICIALEVPGV